MFTKFGAALVLPPLNFLLLGMIGFVLVWRARRAGLWLIAASLLGLYVITTPYVAGALVRTLEPEATPPLVSVLESAGAIVVLGSGTYFDAPEYGSDTAGAATLERLRYSARLQRQTGLPVLVSGGRPFDSSLSEAEQMRSTLEEDFKVPVKWLEDRAANTFESALLTHAILENAGIQRIVLVTHAAHMRRARFAFECAGFEVIPAPTGYTTPDRSMLHSLLPSAQGLLMGRVFFHEAIGLGWYYLRFAWK